jgi:CRISPR/Cas system-associated endoribonuclease Cas2
MKKDRVETRSKKANIKSLILQTASIAGMIGMTAVAPGVLIAMKRLGLTPHYRQIESIEASKNKLIQNGYLCVKNKSLQLTKKGRVYMLRHTFYPHKKVSKKWDRKWRVLIFDIPEKHRFARDQIRIALLNIGFVRLQNSVWVYPYNCEDLVSLLKADLELGKDLLYMIVDTIEEDGTLRKHFKLT